MFPEPWPPSYNQCACIINSNSKRGLNVGACSAYRKATRGPPNYSFPAASIMVFCARCAAESQAAMARRASPEARALHGRATFGGAIMAGARCWSYPVLRTVGHPYRQLPPSSSPHDDAGAPALEEPRCPSGKAAPPPCSAGPPCPPSPRTRRPRR